MNEHEISITTGQDTESKPLWVAACKCGWVGHTQKTELAAERDGDDHRMAIR